MLAKFGFKGAVSGPKINHRLALLRNCSVKHLNLSCLNVFRLAINSQMIRCCYH